MGLAIGTEGVVGADHNGRIVVGSLRTGRPGSRRLHAPGRIRTCGLALRRRTLYPLSYRRVATSLPAVQLTYRIVSHPLATPFRDLTVDDGGGRGRRGGAHGRGDDRLRRGLSRRTTTARVDGVRDRSPRAGEGRCSATTRSRSRRSERASPGSPESRPRRRRSTSRCTTSAASSPGSPSGGSSGCRARASHLVHDRARRPGRDGAGCRRGRAAAFRRLKLKLGGRDGLDVERVRAVRGVTGPAAPGRRERVLGRSTRRSTSIPELERLGVEYVEQPLPAGDPGGALLRARSPLPVYLDEDCHTLERRPPPAPSAATASTLKLAKSRRDPRGDPDGARRPGPRSRRHDRLHDRVRARHSRRLPGRPASATTSTSTATSCSPTTRGPASRSSTASSSPPTARASA